MRERLPKGLQRFKIGENFPHNIRFKRHHKFYVVFFVSLVVFISISSVFYSKLNEMMSYSNETDNAHKIVESLRHIEKLMVDAETGQRGFLLTNDSSFLKPYFNSEIEAYRELNKLKHIIPANAQQQKSIGLLEASMFVRFKYLKENVDGNERNDTAEFKYKLLQGQNSMEETRELTNKIIGEENADLASKRLVLLEHEQTTPNTYKFVFIVSIIMLSLSFWLILKELRTRIKYQKRLEENIIQLNVNNSELEQYAYAASHDLQEPLRKIRIFASMMQQRKKQMLDDEGQSVLDKIDKSADKMQQLLSDLLNFLQLIQKQTDLRDVSIQKSIRAAVTEIENRLDDKIDIRIDELPVIKGVPGQLELLFQELLDNSIKFQSHKRPLKIKVVFEGITTNVSAKGVKAQLSYYKILFQDNGTGFDNVYGDKIFQLFQQIADDKRIEGKGMGLAICRRVMVNHSGYIEAVGELGKGATFSLYFPIGENRS